MTDTHSSGQITDWDLFLNEFTGHIGSAAQRFFSNWLQNSDGGGGRDWTCDLLVTVTTPGRVCTADFGHTLWCQTCKPCEGHCLFTLFIPIMMVNYYYVIMSSFKILNIKYIKHTVYISDHEISNSFLIIKVPAMFCSFSVTIVTP